MRRRWHLESNPDTKRSKGLVGSESMDEFAIWIDASAATKSCFPPAVSRGEVVRRQGRPLSVST